MLENPKQKKGSNPSTMSENLKQKKGLNPGTMPENSKQKEMIESRLNAGEPETRKGIERVQRRKEGAMPQSKALIPCQKPTTTPKVKVTKLEILQTFILEEKPSSLIHNIQYPPTTDRGYALVCISETQISR